MDLSLFDSEKKNHSAYIANIRQHLKVAGHCMTSFTHNMDSNAFVATYELGEENGKVVMTTIQTAPVVVKEVKKTKKRKGRKAYENK